MTTTISSSDGMSLRFPDKDLLAQYERERLLVDLRAYKSVRDRYGVWASNQDKFVSSVDEFNQWDQRHMEDTLSAAIRRGEIEP